MPRATSLSVNDSHIDINEFVQEFIDHTVCGMLSALEGVGEIDTAELSIEREKIIIKVNDVVVPINPFVSKMFIESIRGMVSSLEGVSEINSMKIGIRS